MEPTMTKRGSGYDLEWASSNVSMNVKRVKERNDAIKAEISVTHMNVPITRSTPTLTSESGKDSFVRKLNRRRKGDDYQIDWEAVVEERAFVVIEEYRQGKPDVALADVEEEDGLVWRIENIMLEDITMFYGDGASGKSMTACFMASLLDSGYMNSDHNLVVEPGRVLYLDWETDKYEISSRINRISNGMGIDPKTIGIRYKPMVHSLLKEMDTVLDVIAEHNIEIVVIDSMGLAVGGDIETSEAVLDFFRGVRSLELPVLLISHKNKQGTIFGSVYTFNSCRMVWEVQKSETSNEDGSLDIVMLHRKSNNVPQQQPMAWNIAFEDIDIKYSRKDVYDTSQRNRLTVPRLVEKILEENGKLTRKELNTQICSIKEVYRPQEEVDKLHNTIGTAVTRLKQKEKIDVTGIGDDAVISVTTQQATGENSQWIETQV